MATENAGAIDIRTSPFQGDADNLVYCWSDLEGESRGNACRLFGL